MLSKRNFAMMMTMIIVVLILFLSSAALKEYFNDYDVNHAAEIEIIERQVQKPVLAGRQFLYFGTTDNGYYRAIQEWVEYRKGSLRVFPFLDEVDGIIRDHGTQKNYLLIDGELLADHPEAAVEKLSQFVEQGGVVIFYRLPSYQIISGSRALQDLLGIQKLRGESVRLHEIWLFGGFLLGGETHYLMDGADDPALVDLDREVPWYDISSRTKSYMVGFLSEEEIHDSAINNEDMPALIWRSNLGTGSVFAVNGDYMRGETALGMLDAMIYEAEDYVLYPVVNAQNLVLAGFPDLTVENEDVMAQTYGMTTQQFGRDILWPSLVASAQKGNWQSTAFLSVKQNDSSENEPNRNELIDYLKFFNEEKTEAGISLGRMESADLQVSVKDEYDTLQGWGLNYTFAGGYVRKENKDKLNGIIDGNGQIDFFQDLRTVVGEYEVDQQILSWMTDRITLQNATTNAYRHSYQDNLRLKSLETALGYSNILVDLYRVLWPETREDCWENVAEKMSANMDTYWKPFSSFDKTTISQSDSRVRNFLNGSAASTRTGNQISVQTNGFTGEAYVLLRTHDEVPETMIGGTWKKVEKNAYLLQMTSEEAVVILRPERELYYQK